jgi:hypothetical protein
MESCLQICKSAILQTMYLGGKLSPETAVIWLTCTPAKRARKRIPAQKSSPRVLVRNNNFPTRLSRLKATFLGVVRPATQVAYLLPTHQHGCSMVHPHQKKPLVACKLKDDLALSHWLQKPTNGISTCAFFISIRKGAPGVSVWTSEQAKAEAGNRRLALTDFSRSRIEEHYVASHPAKWSEYQQKLEAKGRSAETKTDFF